MFGKAELIFFFFNGHKYLALKLMQNFFWLNYDYYSWVKFNILLALLEKYWVGLFNLEVQKYVRVGF